MSLGAQLKALAETLALDIGTLKVGLGIAAELATANKTSLVAAINELKTALDLIGTPASINDSAPSSTTSTYSAAQINVLVQTAFDAVVASAPGLLNTLDELAAALGDDPNFAVTIMASLTYRVRVDAVQAFDATQQAQARTNIGAQEAALIGDPDFDFLAAYNAAKA